MSDWYYADNNTQQGPVLESELKGLLSAGKVTPDSLVWKEGMANWTAAKDVPALSAAPVIVSATGTPNPASVTPVAVSDIVGTPEALEVSADDAEKNKIFGIIAYIGILCLVPLLAVKDSPFARYHANQGLTLFLAEIVIWVGLSVIDLILRFILPPSLGFVPFVLSLIQLGPLVLIVIGIINAAKGKCVPLPVIGGVKLIK
jgi:uncharacterized membrane protein